MHVAIAGNIGSGKTSLTEMLAKNYGWHAHYENVDDNPYLIDFYDDMQRWSFNLQIYFVKKYSMPPIYQFLANLLSEIFLWIGKHYTDNKLIYNFHLLVNLLKI